jgi:hypothetical protein
MNEVVSAKDRRVQFDVLPERIAELDHMMIVCGMNTRKELFDNATTLFEWAVDEVRKGRQIASYDRNTDNVEIIRLPVLDRAARRALSPQEALSTGSRAGQPGVSPARLVVASEA